MSGEVIFLGDCPLESPRGTIWGQAFLPSEITLRYSLPVAYALWAISGFGALGLHRFYLGKVGTGFLWLVTGGLAGAGCLYDALTLPRQVREANIKYEAAVAIESGFGQATRMMSGGEARYVKPESTEKTILKIARKNGGQVTPGEVAIESEITVDQARKELDTLASKGLAELRVRASGVVVYFFPEFSSEKSEFVDL